MNSSDSLTQLPDRQALFAYLDDALSANQSLRDITAIMVIKLNKLKQFNIELGYRNTNDLICAVASKCASCLRPNDFIARVNGNEFAIVLRSLKSVAQPTLAANKIRNLFSSPVVINGESIKVSLTVGIAVAPLDGIRTEDTYRCADFALEHAVASCKPIARYGDLEQTESVHTLALERELDRAIAEGRLNNVFQPIIDIESKRLQSVEILLRWYDDEKGQISPDQFIPLAEKTNLIVPLTMWAINNGIREFAHCSALDNEVTLSINVSPLLLIEPHLDALILNAATLWGVPTNRLIIEVTETAIMAEPEKCLVVLKTLHEQGLHIAIDDFGTGYSSLEYMKNFPADILKIDKSFVTTMLADEKNRQIVQAVINLGDSMGMTVVAEGIEDEETLEELRAMGCARGQGFGIGKPMSSDELEAWCELSNAATVAREASLT